MPRESAQTIPYNDQAVRKVATTKHAKQTDYLINDVLGLTLTCYPSGRASFAVRYSVGGKRHRESLGPWGLVTLADARARALAVAAGAAAGTDVLAVEAKEAGRVTLAQLLEERFSKDGRLAPSTLVGFRRVLARHVLPALGSKIAADITPDEFADVLAKIEDRRTIQGNLALHDTHTARSALSGTYRWGQRKRLVKINPIAGLGFTHQGNRRERVLSDAEMIKLWNAIGETTTLTEPMRNIIRLAIFTGQRNNEVAGMQCDELRDIEKSTARWHLHRSRMKRKSADQHVPLPRQAAEIVREALATSSNGKHVFPGEVNGRREGKWRQEHIGQESVSRAMSRVVKTSGLVDVVLHDMRRCITTWLAENGHATPEILDVILHHGRNDVTSKHYNHALYEKQVRASLTAWADHIEQITGGGGSKVVAGDAGKVVALATRRKA